MYSGCCCCTSEGRGKATPVGLPTWYALPAEAAAAAAAAAKAEDEEADLGTVETGSFPPLELPPKTFPPPLPESTVLM